MVGTGIWDEVLFVSSQATEIEDFLVVAAGIAEFQTGGLVENGGKKGIFLPDAGANPDVINASESYTALYPQIRGTRPQPLLESAPVYAFFLAAFRSEYGGRDVTDSTFTANAWDAAWMLMYGSLWAKYQEDGLITPVNIAKGLRQLSAGNDYDVGPNDFIEIEGEFQVGNGVNISGASGPLDYDPVTEETSVPIQVWTVVNNNITGL
jgi:hypothetical protein